MLQFDVSIKSLAAQGAEICRFDKSHLTWNTLYVSALQLAGWLSECNLLDSSISFVQLFIAPIIYIYVSALRESDLLNSGNSFIHSFIAPIICSFTSGVVIKKEP